MENTSNKGLMVMVNHHATVTDRREFLVNNELMSDVTFIVGKSKQRIYAHKQLLVAASDYFCVMFEGRFRESKATEIPLEDIEWPILKEILRHIYCGKVDLNEENIREMFVHSRKFLLPDLLGEVSDFLVQSVTSESALVSLSQNRFYEFQEVDDRCLEFIGDDPFRYFSADDFARIDRSSLEVIVNIKRINCSDWQLWDALKHWQNANPAENLDELKACMNRKARHYCCRTWYSFGSLTDRDDYPEAHRYPELKINVRSKSSVYLYGLGVIVKKGQIRICITSSPVVCILCAKSYDVADRESMAIMDCFFPKCELKPKTMYTIYVSGNGINETKPIQSPDFLKNQLEIVDEDGEAITNIARFYCNTEPIL